MEKLKSIEECLISQIQAQCSDLKQVNAKELGEVVDMVKDLEEAMYYCSIIEAMEKTKEESEDSYRNMHVNYYMEPMYYDGQPRDSSGRYMSTSSDSNHKNYVPYMEYAPYMMRDSKWREDHLTDRSGLSRRMYIEGKQYHGDEQ